MRKKYRLLGMLTVALFISVTILAIGSASCEASAVRVGEIRFFAQNEKGNLPKEMRQYSTDFQRGDNRFIQTEVMLVSDHHAAEGDLKFTLRLQYMRQTKTVSDFTQSVTVPQQYLLDYSDVLVDGGIGFDDPREWQDGEYTVKVYIDNQLAGEKKFTVSAAAHAAP